MRTPRKLTVAILVLLALIKSTSARIGDDLQQLVQRYGTPVVSDNDGAPVFHVGAYEVMPSMAEGRAVQMWYLNYQELADAGKHPLSFAEIHRYCRAGRYRSNRIPTRIC
jgi:hypothetical protein